jgi:hypothetical protein
MINNDTIIIVDDGQTFEGTIKHWQDCFFSKPDHFTDQEFLNQIKDYCERKGWDVKFGYVYH